jgi:hypothetical protein
MARGTVEACRRAAWPFVGAATVVRNLLESAGSLKLGAPHPAALRFSIAHGSPHGRTRGADHVCRPYGSGFEARHRPAPLRPGPCYAASRRLRCHKPSTSAVLVCR